MEGNYYLCGWRTCGAGCEVWVLNSPRVKVRAASFEAADVLLAEKICDRFGDGESRREYIPAPPLRSGGKRLLVTVWGDSSAEVLNTTQLFSRGRCGVCRAILGARNQTPLQVEKPSKQQKNGFFASTSYVMHVFSQEFVDLIQDVSGFQLYWRNVDAPGRGDWVELVGGDCVREVVPRGRNLSGWRCSSCGVERVLAYSDPDGIRSHVAASDFNGVVPGIFAIKHLRGISLGMTDQLWSQVRAKPESKGLMSQTLGLVADEDISKMEKLFCYEDYQEDPHPVPS